MRDVCLESPGRSTTGGGPRRRLRRGSAAALALLGLAAGVWLAAEPLAPATVPRGSIGPYLNGRLPDRLPGSRSRLRAVDAFPRLRFEDPVLLTHDGDPRRLYVCGRQGTIERFENRPDVSAKTMWLDLRDRCQGWDDSGLLGLAFHPDFGRPGSPRRGFVYVWYSHARRPEPGPARPRRDRPRAVSNRLSRFTVPDGADAADPGSELVLIDQPDRDLFHNGGGMFFHPEDGFLYLSLGDEGMGFDNAQRIDRNLFSGVIRIDVDCKGGPISHPPPRRPASGTTAHYYIPDDNPWVGVPGVLEEFWCIGLRSPHRMSYDPVGKTIHAGDVGDRSREEIDVLVKGGNYQWNYREGDLPTGVSRPGTILGDERGPLFAYGHDRGTAVIGGHVYRGHEHAPWLTGRYVFGDVNGRVWALAGSPSGAAEAEPLCDVPLRPGPAYGTGLSSLGVDARGELYLCAIGKVGKVYRLAAAATADRPPPARLSQTGAFRDVRTLEPAPGLVPYEVNAPLWSDGAEKRRWIALPGAGPPHEDRTRIGFAASGPWQFPEGTVFVKHFEIAAEATRPGPVPMRRLETRFLVRDAEGGVYGITYRWREDQADADLIDEAEEAVVPVRGADGVREQAWTFPGRRDCLACHTAAAGFVLGVNTRQLNRSVTYHHRRRGLAVAENQLRGFESAGMLAGFDPRSDLGSLPRLAEPGDEGAGLEHRVRSYLDANCAHCHRPNGVRAGFDARFETPLDRQQLIGGWVIGTEGKRGGELVRRGDPDRSLLLHALRSTEAATRMPPLARNVPDRQAIETLRAWIAGLGGGTPDGENGWDRRGRGAGLDLPSGAGDGRSRPALRELAR